MKEKLAEDKIFCSECLREKGKAEIWMCGKCRFHVRLHNKPFFCKFLEPKDLDIIRSMEYCPLNYQGPLCKTCGGMGRIIIKKKSWKSETIIERYRKCPDCDGKRRALYLNEKIKKNPYRKDETIISHRLGRSEPKRKGFVLDYRSAK